MLLFHLLSEMLGMLHIAPPVPPALYRDGRTGDQDQWGHGTPDFKFSPGSIMWGFDQTLQRWAPQIFVPYAGPTRGLSSNQLGLEQSPQW